MHDFTKLRPTEHMLAWLGAESCEAIAAEVERILQEQVPGTQLTEFRVTSDPHWITGARPDPQEPRQAILVRTGTAFEFELRAVDPGGREHRFGGVFTCVAVGLDDPPNGRSRVWFDIGATLETHGDPGELQLRVQLETYEASEAEE